MIHFLAELNNSDIFSFTKFVAPFVVIIGKKLLFLFLKKNINTTHPIALGFCVLKNLIIYCKITHVFWSFAVG